MVTPVAVAAELQPVAETRTVTVPLNAPVGVVGALNVREPLVAPRLLELKPGFTLVKPTANAAAFHTRLYWSGDPVVV